MLDTTQIEVSAEGTVATLALANEATRNALNLAMQKELLAALDRIEADPAARAVVLTGRGKGFCSGAELGGLRAEGSETLGETVARQMDETTHPLIERLRGFPKPVIAAVNGAAAGMGASLALACDMVVAAETAFFVFPFAPNLGLVPDCGATWHLARRLGPARAMKLALTGERLAGPDAVALGLIAEATPADALPRHAQQLATAAGAAPPHMVAELRAAFDAALTQDFTAQLEYERRRQRTLLDGEAFAEGTTAFLEKRAPDFRKVRS
ncbi:enoyl-CoA hydratase-related protein [Roseivivax marinus]|uniref:enoyl-CoA hydratase/isomerase family protein n=1 Tax=Roseivivax marinus TaxID=1379903 RepID=UPI001F039212|nr:enoyl-CoA hydratase-related protein [Roseivivax marinus]UMA66214.1 enoyl-CoA hydratase-related protein [Roseivivax marinus]